MSKCREVGGNTSPDLKFSKISSTRSAQTTLAPLGAEEKLGCKRDREAADPEGAPAEKRSKSSSLRSLPEEDRSVRSTSWVYTRYFKETEDPNQVYDELATKFLEFNYCTRAIFQLEEVTRLHMQGACMFKDNFSRKQLKEFVGNNCRCEPMGGTWNDQKYCMKEKSKVRGPFIKGTPPKPGRRTDWEGLKQLIETPGTTIYDIRREYYSLYMRYSSKIESDLREQQQRPPQPRPELPCHILWGDTGTKKSLWIQQWCQKMNYSYHEQKHPQWWGFYGSQEVIELSEFDPDDWSDSEFKRIIDIHEHIIVAVKGGHKELKNKIWFITTNFDPRSWPKKWQHPAIWRRITSVTHFYRDNNGNIKRTLNYGNNPLLTDQ